MAGPKGKKKVMETEVRGRGWTKRQKKGNGRCWSHQLEAVWGAGAAFLSDGYLGVPGSQFGAGSNQGLVMCIFFFLQFWECCVQWKDKDTS